MSLSRPLGALLVVQGWSALADRTTDLYRLGLELDQATGPSAFASSSLLSKAIREMVVDAPLMCGNSEIRSSLHVGSEEGFDVERVKNIRFDEAFDSANRYIEKKKDEEERLAAELKDLEGRWYQASTEANSGKPAVPEATVKKVLSSSFTAGFKSLQGAVAIDCSELPEANPGAEDPFEATKRMFSQDFEQEIGAGHFSEVVRGRVKELCVDVLGLKADENTGTCYSLCDTIGAAAEAISGKFAIRAATPGELTEQLQQKRTALEGVKAEIKDCETTREGIRTYASQIKSIVAEHDSHGKTQREIRRRLTEVMDSLRTYSAAVGSETELLEQLMTLLKKTRDEDSELAQEIAQNVEEQRRLQAAHEEVKADLGELQTHLGLTQEAVKAMQAFKAGLVLTMQSFVQIYDDAIRRPLRDSGITKVIEAATEDMWPHVEMATAAVWGQPTDRARELETQCKAVAERSHALCDVRPVSSEDQGLNSQKQDSSMCGVGRELEATCGAELQPGEYVDGVREAIVEKQRQVRQAIERLKEEIENLVARGTGEKANGEPEWLRRYASILPTTKFYNDFVSKWMATGAEEAAAGEAGEEERPGAGVIFNMLKVMNQVEAQTKTKVAYATTKVEELALQYVQAVKRNAELRGKLSAVEKELSDEEAKRITLSTKLEEYEKELSAKEGERQRLQNQMNALTVNFRDLEGNMKSVFHEFEGGASVNFKGAGDSLLSLSTGPQALKDTVPHRG